MPRTAGTIPGRADRRRKNIGRRTIIIYAPAEKGKENSYETENPCSAAAVPLGAAGRLCRGQAAQTQEQAQSGTRDSVVIAIGSEPETLDPTQGWGHGNAPIVQSTLVQYTADLTFENDLATGYTLSDDGLVWTFTLRDDAYFTDGEKVTAQDVAFTLETAKAAQAAWTSLIWRRPRPSMRPPWSSP